MSATMPSPDVRSLLRLDEGLVHSDVYSSPAVFELEIDRIYHRGWVYVGHESEIPKPGDYVLRWIGKQQVIMNRDQAGKLHLFMNRCRHRANSIVQTHRGNTTRFQCVYHGWTYRNSGELVGVPSEEGSYEAGFRKEDYPLVEPRMEVYRGFIWGNLSTEGGSLMDHLGQSGKNSIDLFCDASPEGELDLSHGHLKCMIHANWKFQGGDGYHQHFTHQANFLSIRAKRRGEKDPIRVGGVEDGFLSRDLGNGHYCLDTRAVARARLPDTSWARKYREDLIKAHGSERAEFVLRTGGNPHTVFMPNLHLVNTADLRLIRPIAVDKFEIYFYCAFLKGAPHELNEARMRNVEDRMGPAGSINPDDVEMFERNQAGMGQVVDPWKYMGRGLARAHVDADEKAPEAYRWANTLTGHYSDEVTQRAQLAWWGERLSQP